MNILVTGATGLVGNLAARRFISQNHTVLALVRNPERAAGLKDLGARLIQGDLEDADSLLKAAQDVDTVVHCAGLVGSGRATAEDYSRVNFQGTRLLLQAARQAGVRRFVFMSTVGVYGLNMLKANVDENTALRRSNGYTNSKIDAEDAVRTSGVPYVILRPYWITGGGDRFLIPAIARLLTNGEFTYIGNAQQQWSLSVVENVSAALATAATHPAAVNKIYNVADATVKVSETVEIIAKALGKHTPTARTSVLSVALHSLFNQSENNPARMTIDLFFPLWRSMTINSEKIRRELDWSPLVDWRESLRTGTLDWKRANPE